MKKKINVIDLDKTLIPYDSFRLLVKKELFKFDLYVIRLTIARVFRLILAHEFKFKLVNYFRTKHKDEFFKKFVDVIYKDVNPEVIKLVEKEADNNTINILLSASPNLFVKYFIQKLGWVGSGSYIDNDRKFVHLYGREKVNWLLRTYKSDNFNYNFAISDSSSDDQLLALFNKHIKWTSH